MLRDGLRKRKRWAATLALSVVFWAAASGAAQQIRRPAPRPPRAVLTATEAFVLGEARALAGPIVRSVAPMPGGPFALIVRHVPDDLPRALADAEGNQPLRDGETQVLLWNRRTGRVSVMWRKRIDERQAMVLGDAEWLPGSDTALIQAYFPRQEPQDGSAASPPSSILLINTRATTARIIPMEPGVSFHAAPNHPFALLTRLTFASRDGQPGPPASFRILRADGSIGAPRALPGDYRPWVSVSEDGTRAYLVRTVVSSDDPPRRTQQYAAYRLSDGTITPLEKRPPFVPGGVGDVIAKLPVRLTSAAATLTDARGRRESVRPVWLERNEANGETRGTSPARTPRAAATTAADRETAREREGRALVAADGEAVTLLPDGSAALYLASDGTLMAVPLARHEAGAYRDGMRALHRAQALQNAKQIGLGILMYAQDYDETLPPSADLADVISPYLRATDVFQNPATGMPGFRFTGAGGGKIGDIERPATTVLGYLEGPGGRAVLYADGHVQWEDDAKKE